LFSNLNINNK